MPMWRAPGSIRGRTQRLLGLQFLPPRRDPAGHRRARARRHRDQRERARPRPDGAAARRHRLGVRAAGGREHDPEKHVLDPIGDGNRFSDKIMLKGKAENLRARARRGRRARTRAYRDRRGARRDGREARGDRGLIDRRGDRRGLRGGADRPRDAAPSHFARARPRRGDAPRDGRARGGVVGNSRRGLRQSVRGRCRRNSTTRFSANCCRRISPT